MTCFLPRMLWIRFTCLNVDNHRSTEDGFSAGKYNVILNVITQNGSNATSNSLM